ncbi:MAG: hypothetical protein ACK551_08190 [Vampirovibrionales bacterium]
MQTNTVNRSIIYKVLPSAISIPASIAATVTGAGFFLHGGVPFINPNFANTKAPVIIETVSRFIPPQPVKVFLKNWETPQTAPEIVQQYHRNKRDTAWGAILSGYGLNGLLVNLMSKATKKAAK